jgi:hypothetical protein
VSLHAHDLAAISHEPLSIVPSNNIRNMGYIDSVAAPMAHIPYRLQTSSPSKPRIPELDFPWKFFQKNLHLDLAPAKSRTMAALETHLGYYLWKYIPSSAAAIIFILLFLVATGAHAYKTWTTGTRFCWAFTIGCFCTCSSNLSYDDNYTNPTPS